MGVDESHTFHLLSSLQTVPKWSRGMEVSVSVDKPTGKEKDCEKKRNEKMMFAGYYIWNIITG